MAKKTKATPIKSVSLDDQVQYGDNQESLEETVIDMPRGGAIAVAIRTAETATEFRTLITIRAGTQAHKIKFNFGNYGGGPIVQGGGDGDPPPCP